MIKYKRFKMDMNFWSACGLYLASDSGVRSWNRSYSGLTSQNRTLTGDSNRIFGLYIIRGRGRL